MSEGSEIFEIKDKSLAGRLGTLITTHGKITTPTLFPVINPLHQEVDLNTIRKIGYNAIITNAYILKKHCEQKVLSQGLHEFLGFTGPIMTDSGGYQILEYGDVEVEPQEIVMFQEKIGSDIAVILDVPTGGHASYDEAKWTVEETIRRAKLSTKYMENGKTIWVYPVQGGRYLDLLKYSAEKLLEMLQYKMVSIGSPTQLLEKYDYRTLVKMIVTVKTTIPPNYPVHLFGAGHPMFFPFAVALGIDTFDSASYILYAKDERLIFPHGTLRLRELKELPCSCPICSKYTIEELLSLKRSKRVKLIAIHNLYIIWQEIKRIREAIRENSLWDLLEEKSRAHPSLLGAFKELIKYVEYVEKHHPISKPEVSGIFLYDSLSLSRPEVVRHRKWVLAKYAPPEFFEKAMIIFGLEEKPLTRSQIYNAIKMEKDLQKLHILAFMPYFGIVPEELAETYPLSQHEKEYDEKVLKESFDVVLNYLSKHGKKYDLVLFVILQKDLEEQVLNLAKKLENTFKIHVIKHYDEDIGGLIRKLKDYLHVM